MKFKLMAVFDFDDRLCDWDNFEEVTWVHEMLDNTPLALHSDEIGDIIATIKLVELPLLSCETVEP